MTRERQKGFTLVEIAIVLVIIGLLLGGILKGQELVTNARVRNVADQISSVKAAFFAFQDRYRALPGDYLGAATNIPVPGGAALPGDGNGQITGAEQVNAWNHLANAGFISCSQCIAPPGAAPASPNNSLVNAYNGVMLIQTDGVYNENGAAVGPVRTNLKTGNQIPANILSEVDRKLDDANPRSGEIRFSAGQPFGVAPDVNTCAPLAANNWTVTGAGAPDANCGGAVIF